MSQQEYHIYTRQYAEELSQRINKMCSEEKLPLTYKENFCGKTLALTFSLPETYTDRHGLISQHEHKDQHNYPEESRENILCRIQKYYFIQALIDVIQECWEKPQVYLRLKKTFEWTDEEIMQNGESILYRLNCDERGNKNLRGKFLARELITYFEEQKSLDIEGYLDFRGKTYHNVLARQVDSAVAEMQMEEEEQSSLELMRNILRRRPEKFSVLHVNLVSSNNISLWSSKGSLLSVSANGEPCEMEFSLSKEVHEPHSCESDFNSPGRFHTSAPNALEHPDQLQYHNPEDYPIEDVLVPVLYFFGPREIILHSCHRLPCASSDILAVMGVLQNVFDEAFSLCPGCEKCT